MLSPIHPCMLRLNLILRGYLKPKVICLKQKPCIKRFSRSILLVHFLFNKIDTDCLFRIATIHKKMKKSDSHRIIQEITEIDPTNIDAILWLGNHELQNKKHREARKWYEKVLVSMEKKHDPYALVASKLND